MKLSMWMLFDELEAYGATSAIQDGNCVITSVRVFSFEESLSKSYVYIGSSHDFFGNGNDQVMLVHGHDIIFVNKMDISEVLNRVIQIFDRYRDWDERLQRACLEPNAFQAMLDVAHEMFQCPMFIGHKNLRIYAITQQYPEDEVYEGWDEVKALNTMPMSLMKRVKALDKAKYPDTLDPVAMSTADDKSKFFNYQIRANCYFCGNIWGHLYLYYKKPIVSTTIMQLARHTADICGEMLNKSLSKNVEKYMKYSFLVDVLDGKEKAEEVFLNLYWQLNWDVSANLVLYKISALPTVFDSVLYDWLCDNIAEKATNDIVFPYKKSIVVISCQCGNKPPLLLSHILSIIPYGNYHCGVSYTFSGLQNIAYHYFQAGYAIESASDPVNRLHFFKDCSYNGLVHFVKTRISWRSFIMPSLFKLIETDNTQGTEYYKTLYCLLVNKGHSSNTSIDLYIHRNTLKYRLDKITHILETDIQDESVAAYLRFCYALMMDDYPVTLPNRLPDSNSSIQAF